MADDESTVIYDESTGLPALPDGYFWRVSRSEALFISIYPRVTICKWVKRRVGRGYREVETEFSKASFEYEVAKSGRSVPETIRGLARDAADEFYRWRKVRSQPDHCGDYPPKRLP